MRWRSEKAGDRGPGMLEAAFVEVVCERGYAATTIEAVCERAGVGREEFEQHFDDLEDCLCSYFEAGASELLADSEEVFAGEGDWRERLRAVAQQAPRLPAGRPGAGAGADGRGARGRRPGAVGPGPGDAGADALHRSGAPRARDPDSMSVATAEAICGAIFNQILFEVEKGNFESLPALLPKLMYSAVLPYSGPMSPERNSNAPCPYDRRAPACLAISCVRAGG